MHTLAKIYKRGANFGKSSISKLLTPGPLSQYIQENVNWWSFVFGLSVSITASHRNLEVIWENIVDRGK